MAMIKCKECGSELSDKAAACPKCGAKVPKPKLWLWVPLGLVAAFLGFGMVAGNSPQAEEKSKARRAIDFCWKEQQRKSLAPAEQRFVAGACEQLERDFLVKHGHSP